MQGLENYPSAPHVGSTGPLETLDNVLKGLGVGEEGGEGNSKGVGGGTGEGAGEGSGAWFKSGEHGSKGLCQERAFVSGMLAADTVIDQLSKSNKLDDPIDGTMVGTAVRRSAIQPIRVDEVQVRVGRRVNKAVAKVLDPFGILTAMFVR
jgi:hypothetical protein